MSFLTGRCGFCGRQVWRQRESGAWEVLVPTVEYCSKFYCADPCWKKLERVAERTGGVL